jgi:hypothetical protein
MRSRCPLRGGNARASGRTPEPGIRGYWPSSAAGASLRRHGLIPVQRSNNSADMRWRPRGMKCPSFAKRSPSRNTGGRREGRTSTEARGPRAERMHGAGTTGPAGRPGPPCAMALRLIRALLGVPGLLATVARALHQERYELGASIGAPEPRDFAVRSMSFVGMNDHAATRRAHRIQPPTLVTTAIRPSSRRPDSADITRIPKFVNQNIFRGRAGQDLRRRTRRANQVDARGRLPAKADPVVDISPGPASNTTRCRTCLGRHGG